MKKSRWFIGLLVFLAIVLGPVLVAQAKSHANRTYDKLPLSSLQYTEVTFRNEVQDMNLAGMLFIPDGDGPFPSVAIIHGAGTSKRENSWYLTLVKYLQENGLVVLLPDKRGLEKSEGGWRTSSYEDLATDSVAAVNFLKNQDMVEVSEIGIIGMSQGGQFAPLVVHQSPDVAFMIDVVGTSLNSYDVLHYGDQQPTRDGIPPRRFGFDRLSIHLCAQKVHTERFLECSWEFRCPAILGRAIYPCTCDVWQ